MATAGTKSTALPLVLRKADAVHLAVYNEAAATLTQLTSEGAYSGDYTECEVCFNPANGCAFAHATSDTLRYSEVVKTATGGYTLRTVFEVALDHTVLRLSFSPKGTYLLSYANLDRKRLPAGNLCIYATATGARLRQFNQARWPAVVWSADESFAVRPVQNFIHVLEGKIAAASTVAGAPQGGDGGEGEDEEEAASAQEGALQKLDLMVGQESEIALATSPDPEGLPLLAVFKPFFKNRQAEVAVYRLPEVRDKPMLQFFFGRAESARLAWSSSGQQLAVLVQSDRDRSGKSYYGTANLHLVDIMGRSSKEIKVNKTAGETVHDFQWSPPRARADELLVVHGAMPRNRTTLYNKKGIALLTLGEAPRNMACWSPDGRAFVLGGSGNLAGDYHFYRYTPAANPQQQQPTANCVGEFNEKCSFQTWAPDSHNFMCATVFTRLRVDNKIVFTKTNGERVLTERFPVLYAAHWVTDGSSASTSGEGEPRPDSPRPAGEQKAKKYVPPGGGSARAAAALNRPDGSTTKESRPAGPVGATPPASRKKKR